MFDLCSTIYRWTYTWRYMWWSRLFRWLSVWSPHMKLLKKTCPTDSGIPQIHVNWLCKQITWNTNSTKGPFPLYRNSVHKGRLLQIYESCYIYENRKRCRTDFATLHFFCELTLLDTCKEFKMLRCPVHLTAGRWRPSKITSAACYCTSLEFRKVTYFHVNLPILCYSE